MARRRRRGRHRPAARQRPPPQWVRLHRVHRRLRRSVRDVQPGAQRWDHDGPYVRVPCQGGSPRMSRGRVLSRGAACCDAIPRRRPPPPPLSLTSFLSVSTASPSLSLPLLLSLSPSPPLALALALPLSCRQNIVDRCHRDHHGTRDRAQLRNVAHQLREPCEGRSDDVPEPHPARDGPFDVVELRDCVDGLLAAVSQVLRRAVCDAAVLGERPDRRMGPRRVRRRDPRAERGVRLRRAAVLPSRPLLRRRDVHAQERGSVLRSRCVLPAGPRREPVAMHVQIRERNVPPRDGSVRHCRDVHGVERDVPDKHGRGCGHRVHDYSRLVGGALLRRRVFLARRAVQGSRCYLR